jgi:hypothetical protein
MQRYPDKDSTRQPGDDLEQMRERRCASQGERHCDDPGSRLSGSAAVLKIQTPFNPHRGSKSVPDNTPEGSGILTHR